MYRRIPPIGGVSCTAVHGGMAVCRQISAEADTFAECDFSATYAADRALPRFPHLLMQPGELEVKSDEYLRDHPLLKPSVAEVEPESFHDGPDHEYWCAHDALQRPPEDVVLQLPRKQEADGCVSQFPTASRQAAMFTL